MDKQELKAKIIGIIKGNGTYNGKSLSFDYYVVNDEDLADALIENIIKDKENDLKDLLQSFNLMKKLYKDKLDELAIKMKEIYNLTLENTELKLRADVSELALDIAEEIGELCGNKKYYIEEAKKRIKEVKMTDKEKIIEIIKSNEKAFFEEKVIKGNSIHDNEFAERLADSLIESGIGDVSEYKNHRIIISNPVCRDICQEGLLLPPEFDLKQLYGAEEVEQIVKEREDYKYSNKVMTRALHILSEKFVKLKGYSSEILDLAESVTVNRVLQQAAREIEEERE